MIIFRIIRTLAAEIESEEAIGDVDMKLLPAHATNHGAMDPSTSTEYWVGFNNHSPESIKTLRKYQSTRMYMRFSLHTSTTHMIRTRTSLIHKPT
ncbi:hypothetical protein M8J75_016465 [Diaphorina citri]|nr:hypothetical protein M8J75_016465 [Diaphorina citri]